MAIAILRCSHFCIDKYPESNVVFGQEAMDIKITGFQELTKENPDSVIYKHLEPFKQFEWLVPEETQKQVNEFLDKLNAGAGLAVMREESEACSS
eukprot:6256511-Lingulodinium_polyedra.AAC.1